MVTPQPLTLPQTSPGIYETRWTLPDDIEPGTYELVGVEVLRGSTLAATPAAVLIILPALAALTPPPGAPPAAVAQIQPSGVPPPPAAVVLPQVPGRDIGWRDPRLTSVETPLWVTNDDTIIVGVRTSVTGLVLALIARAWAPNGSIIVSALSIRPIGDRSLQFFSLPLTYGYLVSAAVVATAGSPLRGQCLVSLRLARGLITSFNTHWFMGQDYVTVQQAVYWPFPRTIGAVEWPGVPTSFLIGNPAAGSDWTQTVPSGARWRLWGVVATLATSAAVGNRTVDFLVIPSAGVVIAAAGTQVLAPSSSLSFSWIPGLPVMGVTSLATADQFIPRDLIMDAGTQFRPFTNSLAAGDQWQGIRVYVEEVLNDAP